MCILGPRNDPHPGTLQLSPPRCLSSRAHLPSALKLRGNATVIPGLPPHPSQRSWVGPGRLGYHPHRVSRRKAGTSPSQGAPQRGWTSPSQGVPQESWDITLTGCPAERLAHHSHRVPCLEAPERWLVQGTGPGLEEAGTQLAINARPRSL